ncbi:SMI1/KNR4 family protein [Streptantibioticus cattleyicolor]|uniref:Knr4/Smi1-like domain-containing protein n=1 Tax=Streptantibioticus cattleyicolor (strain ATCC 35852 / DSM 46488 / JCM 4925 / NBRC 14057 / NRRL 8057) TaxID=1003195 RepID=F8JN05_STREN|nr:SMI1/KNR4 family protein [Streptantibioticus cattleyicolor]AEW98340.1 hypothetical protein SCATT_p01470 [Streptantibioticus cattleyicolor NRRL 8057 = DSM 46488]CCB72602.1 protein of unknown function [Streptantibioticus cattleyicolor NRRL 8057 = DSM 46488]
MSPSSPSTVAEWRGFLEDYSAKFLASDYLRQAEADGQAPFPVSDTQRESGWLGREPATEEEVRAAEERLGVRLPPAYRSFLLTSNGWNSIGPVDLLKADEIAWFAEREAWLVDAWSEPGEDFFIGDFAMLDRCLVIANDDGGGGCYWLLHADGARGNGEWTAYEWWPGDGDVPQGSVSGDFAALVTSTAENIT